MRDSDEARPRRDLSLDRREDLGGGTLANRRDAKRGAGGDQSTEKPGVLRIGRHDLVAWADAEATQHDVASFGRRAGEGDSLRMCPQQARELGAEHLTFVQDLLKVRSARSALLQLAALHRLHGRYRRARERAKRAGVQVGAAVEHRQSAAYGYQVDVIIPKAVRFSSQPSKRPAWSASDRTSSITVVETIDQADVSSRASAAGM